MRIFRNIFFRNILIVLSGVICMVAVASASAGTVLPKKIDAIVRLPTSEKKSNSVETEKTPVYHSIAAALEHRPAAKSSGEYRIFIEPGTYTEKLTVTSNGVSFIGSGVDKTIITYSAYNGLLKDDGNKWGTSGSATLTIQGTDFSATELTIANGFDFYGNDSRSEEDPARVSGSQAVALLVDAESDKNYFNKVKLLGYQDTAYFKAGRTYIENSLIAGVVDYIFGAGQVVIENSEIRTRARGKKLETVGHVTAPSTNFMHPFGIVFLHSKFTKEPGVPAHSVSLGRPWHPTTVFPDGRYADPRANGSTIIIDCFLDDHIKKEGWDGMNGTAREPGKKDWFGPETARFFEYNNHGKGAILSPSRRQLSDAEAKKYTERWFLGAWNPTKEKNH